MNIDLHKLWISISGFESLGGSQSFQQFGSPCRLQLAAPPILPPILSRAHGTVGLIIRPFAGAFQRGRASKVVNAFICASSARVASLSNPPALTERRRVEFAPLFCAEFNSLNEFPKRTPRRSSPLFRLRQAY